MDPDERQLWRKGVHRWRRGVDPRPGRHRAFDAWPYMKLSAAALATIAACGLYLSSLRPDGQLQPPRLPGVEQRVPAVQDSAVEGLQRAGDPPASRSKSYPAPAAHLSTPPDRPRPPDESSSPPAAAATQRADQADASATPCPPPLPPPPRPAKSKKPKVKVTVKLNILKPRASPSG